MKTLKTKNHFSVCHPEEDIYLGDSSDNITINF